MPHHPLLDSHYGFRQAIPIRYLYNAVSKVCQENQALKTKSQNDDEIIADLKLEVRAVPHVL
eukprot:1025609-Rhodomonas_salina.1